MLETSARLLRLLSLLQARRDWTGTELAARLGVTTRTIRNDVDRLRGLGYWMLGIFLDYGMAETDWDAYVAIETPFRSGEAHNLLLAPEEVTAVAA